MKFLMVLVLLLSFSPQSFATNYEFDRAVYLECNTCSTASDFKQYGLNHFNNNYYSQLNQAYAYTIVNHSESKAYFIDITHKYREDPESGYDLDVVIPYALTDSNELLDDYELAKYAIRNSSGYSSSSSQSQSAQTVSGFKISKSSFVTSSSNDDFDVLSVRLNGVSISSVQYTGVSAVAGQISQKLDSDTTLSSGWHKLAGRAVIIVEFDDGKLGAYFKGIYTTDMYSYLEGTAVMNDGTPAPVSMTGGTPTGGSSSGLTSPGSGSWTVASSGSSGGGGVFGCTSIDGGTPVCEWIPF